MAKVAPASRMRCLARLMRWAMVASGTKNALAISAVVSPPTARSVSAIWDGAVSAGWQHRQHQHQRVVPVHGHVLAGDPEHLGRGRAEHEALLAAAPGPLGPDQVDQTPRGDGGQPPARAVGHAALGPAGCGLQQRLLDGVLAQIQLAVAAEQRAEDLRREISQQVLGVSWRGHISVPASCRIGHTSTALWAANGIWAASSSARASSSTSSRQKLDTNSLASM